MILPPKVIKLRTRLMLASSLSCVKFGYWEATGKSNWKKSVGMHFHHCQPHCNNTTDFWLCVYIDNALQDSLPQKCLCHAVREVAAASCVCSRSLSNILGKNRSEKWVGKSLNVFQKCKKLEMLAIYIAKIMVGIETKERTNGWRRWSVFKYYCWRPPNHKKKSSPVY